MDANGVVRSVEALFDADDDVAEAFLYAAVYVRALRRGESPRSVVEALWKAMPSSEAWPPFRTALLAVLEASEAAGDP